LVSWRIKDGKITIALWRENFADINELREYQAKDQETKIHEQPLYDNATPPSFRLAPW